MSRSTFPIVNDQDRAYFVHEPPSRTRSACSRAARPLRRDVRREPDQLVRELAEDDAVAAADTQLLTVPNQLCVDHNAHVLDSVVRHVGPALGWR